MNRNLLQLLGGYLKASGGLWLAACLAVQFLATSAMWALGGRHELLPGALLFAIGGMWATPGRSLPWQILPISRREMALANWWAVAMMPGIVLTLALAFALMSNHSEGWPAPSNASFVLQIAGIWSALGYIIWLPPGKWSHAGYRGAPLVLLSWGIPLLAGFYGYPLGYRARGISIPIMAAGCVLLLLSFLRARRGHVPTGATQCAVQATHGTATDRAGAVVPAGWPQLIPATLMQAAAMLGFGLGGACLLRYFYPHATEPLLWVFLIGVAIWSVPAGRRWTHSLWCWRCLPVTTRRLALAIEAVELLPLTMTLLAAWAAGRLAPHIALPLPGWLAAAVVALVAGGNAWARISRQPGQPAGARRWLAYSMPLAYLSFLPAAQLAAHQLYWLPAIMWIGTAFLLIASFRSTLSQMRSPESAAARDNEAASFG